MPDTLDIVFAPYGRDATTGEPFPPHPTQQVIREWAGAARAGEGRGGVPVLWVQHGVNAGGTRGALTPAIEYAFEQPGLRVLIGRKDYTDLRASGIETFLAMVDDHLILERDVQAHRFALQTDGAPSQVFFRELKDVRSLGSQEFAAIVVLEAAEIDLEAYRVLKQRCRQGALPSFLILEGNPPTAAHWLARVQDRNDPEYDPDLTVLKLTSRENWDHMTPAYRRSLETMPPLWRQRMVEAELGSLPSGTPVYGAAFVEPLHVRPVALIPDRPVLRFWDFGLRRPAVLWAQQDEARRLYLAHEWVPLEVPEVALIEGVIARTNEWYGARVCWDAGDPAAAHRDPHGISTLQRLSERGISLHYRRTTYQERIPLVNRKLSEMVGALPAITIDARCRTLIEALAGGYHYREATEGTEITVRMQEPVKDGIWDNVANAFEYGLINLYLPASATAARLRREQRVRLRRQAERRGIAVF